MDSITEQYIWWRLGFSLRKGVKYRHTTDTTEYYRQTSISEIQELYFKSRLEPNNKYITSNADTVLFKDTFALITSNVHKHIFKNFENVIE